MNAIILSIGDELVLGQTVDTNSAWLSQQLAGVGCTVSSHITVGDDQRAIEDAMREAAERADFLIVTGGIGPTADDLTRQALAEVMGVPLEMNAAWLAKLHAFFQQRGRPMPQTNEIQAMIPRGAQILENELGTAAGISAELGGQGSAGAHEAAGAADRQQPAVRSVSADHGDRLAAGKRHGMSDCRVFVMPGVPKEMKGMFTGDVLPVIRQRGGGAVILSRTLHTFGVGESAIAEILGELMDRHRNPSVGTTVANGMVSLRINARFGSPDQAARELEEACRACRQKLGQLIFGQDEITLQEAVAGLLVEAGAKVTTAESCTGGLLAKMLTDVAGSSAYFKIGFITYSNQAKYERLGVSSEMINIYGAVSETVVQAMAKNAQRLAKSRYALAISGVAGPSGGSPAKPVGTVCIALAFSPDEPPLVRTFNFPGDREWIRDRSAKMALTMLRYHLLGVPMPF
jgi:nicotinamide-nucleotide amidase